MKRFFKGFLLVLLVIFIIIQFFHSPKNQSYATDPQDISTQYPVVASVQNILIKACYDCHSNHTRYPWYNNIQPVAWWLNNHIQNGKKMLNFSIFTSYSVGKQFKKLDDITNEIKGGGMPLSSYTLIHRNAILSDSEKVLLYGWVDNIKTIIQSKYPSDSLQKTR